MPFVQYPKQQRGQRLPKMFFPRNLLRLGQSHGQHCPGYAERKARFRRPRTKLFRVEYEAAMPGRTAALVFSLTVLGFAGGMAIRARGVGQAPAADQQPSEQERGRLLATGKELFMARCARCHDERGDKPLKTGPPLNERGLSTDEIARAVNGRLRDKTGEERGAVTLYISTLMKTRDSEEKPASKPSSTGTVASPPA